MEQLQDYTSSSKIGLTLPFTAEQAWQRHDESVKEVQCRESMTRHRYVDLIPMVEGREGLRHD
jgi:hypothetical protein